VSEFLKRNDRAKHGFPRCPDILSTPFKNGLPQTATEKSVVDEIITLFTPPPHRRRQSRTKQPFGRVRILSAS
jgi:hypothetical protein